MNENKNNKNKKNGNNSSRLAIGMCMTCDWYVYRNFDRDSYRSGNAQYRIVDAHRTICWVVSRFGAAS